MDPQKSLKIAKNGYIVMSIVFIFMGVCIIIWPDFSAEVFCNIIGILMIIYGVIKIMGYFSKDYYCLAFQFDLACGILMIAVGILILVRRQIVVSFIFAILGLIILTDALLKIQMSIDAKKFGLSLWRRILAAAIIAGVFGFMLLVKPFETAEAMMVLVGIALVTEGTLNLLVAIYTIKILNNFRQDIIDME